MSGVIYYNKGRKCLVRLLVSAWSLRRHYAGPACVLWEGDPPPDWVRSECERLNLDLREFTPVENVRPLVRKAELWRYSPYQTTLFLDADTLVLADPSPLFAEIEAGDFMTYHFNDWRTDAGRVSRRIRGWLPACGQARVDAALAYGPAVNTGVHGYRLDSPFLPVWEKLTREGFDLGCTQRLVDELAAQMLLPDFNCRIVGPEWGESGKFGDATRAKILHFHGNKQVQDSPACDLWKAAYWQYRNTSPAYAELGDDGGDKRLRRYLRQTVRTDVTIVTGCSGKYVDVLAKNWQLWMATPGIREQKFIVFHHGTKPEFLSEYRNVTCIPWRFRERDATVSERERMLTAFVFGAARQAKTPYWLKLDADTVPTGRAFEWPDYRGAAITGQRWGYTRAKGDPNTPAHWLNRLDAWYGGEPAFPADIPPRSRFGHPRVNSFCCIEATEHTRHVAELCKRDCADRLPVPSQDTTSFYVALRMGNNVQRVNMKRYFRQ